MTKLEVVASVWIDAGSDDELQINSIWPNYIIIMLHFAV